MDGHPAGQVTHLESYPHPSAPEKATHEDKLPHPFARHLQTLEYRLIFFLADAQSCIRRQLTGPPAATAPSRERDRCGNAHKGEIALTETQLFSYF